MQQHYSMQDMMFDPLPMSNGMYHQPSAVGNHMMHQQHPGQRAGGIQSLGMMHQQGMVPPEDDLDDLMSALGDPVSLGTQQQQHQHMGQVPNHVYDQSHLVPPRSQAPNLQGGRTQGLPMTSQAPMQQGGMPGTMHLNGMAPNGLAGGTRMGVGMQQQSSMTAPMMSSSIGGNVVAPAAVQRAAPQAAVAPSAIVPATTSRTKASSTASRALTTSSINDGSSDEDGGMGEDDSTKKKERRRQQVRYASRRRRKKQKDEESFLRDRISELKEQIRIIGGDLTEQCSQMAGMSEQALTEAYEKQMDTVQTLRKDNNKLKEQLLQHENFARMIQYGLNALPSDCRDVDRKKIAGVPMWISDQMNPLKGPTLVVDLNMCHEAVRHAYNELKTFGPSVNSKTNVCYAMGWKTELWAASTCLNFRAVRSISDKNIREVADASWEIITSPDKFKRIYPDVKQFRILQKVTDDIVVVHRIASVASDMSDREFISVAFRFRDGDNYFIGIKSITVQTECAENCIRGEECQGWMFVGGENETSQWKAHFLGYYDVKGEKDDKVLNQLANEAMFEHKMLVIMTTGAVTDTLLQASLRISIAQPREHRKHLKRMNDLINADEEGLMLQRATTYKLEMDQRNNPYGIPAGRPGMPNGMPQQQRPQQPGMQQQHYSMQDMMFDPLPMNNGMYHQQQTMHQQHPGMGMMQQQGMMAPEDDPRFVDDLLGVLGNDSVGLGAQQQQQHMGHVYDQSHLMPPHSQAQNLQAGRAPMTSQAPMQQGGMSGVMHLNGMAPGAGGMQHQQQQPAMTTPSGLGGLGGNVVAPAAVQRAAPQAAVAPSAIVPATTSRTKASSTASRALTTSSINDGSSDEDGGMGEDDSTKKKERRRQQVRYASRRRRKKQKDEESFLRDRISELKEQIRIIGGDLTEQCSQMAGMSEQALTEAYEKQMDTVQTLRKDNNKLKEQLLQHENFARMIQYGLNALPSDCRDVDRKKIAGVPMWISDQMNPLKGPTLVVDLNMCHEAVRHAYNELKTFGPSVNSKTNVCYAMGWKTELWAASTCLNFRAMRSISDKNIREVANASWDIITSPEKCKRIYPDVKQFRILQKVTDDIVVVHRIASVASDLSDREFISVAFRLRDGDDYYIGLKSITVQTECAENCIRAEECQGWMFISGEKETSQWKAHFLGYYDVKGEKDDKVLNQLANEAMFGMLRWESEAMHPLSV
ncbi:hypothetical protein BBO99_00005523 [Phytophthora kernoviae]|uniref:BZIP domain-containing protein n=1 Tax=Phytophthora kernoviae TaxID=325452 RepID=A0A3R7J2Y6_9STRA|nr:hypothetical protein BBI17_005149 [Phytophthora kernoviae]RLN79070.1 hypothetical protein BBO99_00005523 [Phytophthora kernoviae]